MSFDPKQYWNERAAVWTLQYRGIEDLYYEQVLKKYLDPTWRVLEIGCGDGRWSPYFPHYLGIDISENLIKLAKAQHPGKKFMVFDVAQGLDMFSGIDLVFDFTCLMAVPDAPAVVFPDGARLLLVEPALVSEADYCFDWDYQALFGVVYRETVETGLPGDGPRDIFTKGL